ncbi:MAG: hypothetical protein JXQ69_00865 [Paludibacteraceae bacterium]|nr:hypothetical protein [Paludibacteraceae bacterium]MBN2786849.1 hypothetical protein [Paludibacteraceae bacterium]
MKKMYLLKPTMLLIMSALTLSFNACKDDEPEVVQDQFEPNNTIVAASNTTLGTDVNGGIAEAADVDFYKITGSGSSKIDLLKFALTNASDANFSLVIYNKDKVEIAQVPAAGKSANLSYNLETAESEFYVKVVGTDASVYPANYTLKVSFQNAADEFEGNDIIGSATAFPLALVKDCNLLTNDVDFYMIQDLSSENVWDQYDVKLVNKTADMNPSMEIYDENKVITNYVAINAGAGLDITQTIFMRSGASNARYVKVYTTSAISTVPAGYTLEVIKKNVNEASEPNDLYTNARYIQTAGTYTGTIVVNKNRVNPDVDFIKIQIPASTEVTRVVSGTGIVYDTYYSWSLNDNPTFDDSNLNANGSMYYTLSNTSTTSSLYLYLAVKSTSDLANYSITLTFSPI